MSQIENQSRFAILVGRMKCKECEEARLDNRVGKYPYCPAYPNCKKMTGEPFDLAWNQVRKEAWWNEPEKNADLDAAVNANMKEHKRKIGKNPENPTGNKTIQRVIDRVRGNPTPKKEATADQMINNVVSPAVAREIAREAFRKPAKLESETLRRLHEKVKKD